MMSNTHYEQIVDVETEYKRIVSSHTDPSIITSLLIDRCHSIERDTGQLNESIGLCQYCVDHGIDGLNELLEQLNEYSYYVYQRARIHTIDDIPHIISFNELIDMTVMQQVDLYMSNVSSGTIVNDFVNVLQHMSQSKQIDTNDIALQYMHTQSVNNFTLLSYIIQHILTNEPPHIPIHIEHVDLLQLLYNILYIDDGVLAAITSVAALMYDSTQLQNTDQLILLQHTIDLAKLLYRYHVKFTLAQIRDVLHTNDTIKLNEFIISIPITAPELTDTEWIELFDELIELHSTVLQSDSTVLSVLIIQYMKASLMALQLKAFEYVVHKTITQPQPSITTQSITKSNIDDDNNWEWDDIDDAIGVNKSNNKSDVHALATSTLNTLTVEQIESTVINTVIELVNSATSINDNKLISAEQCLTLLPLSKLLAPDNATTHLSTSKLTDEYIFEQQLLQGLYILQAIGIDIIPQHVRQSKSTIEVIQSLLQQNNTLYKRRDALLELNSLWSNGSDEQQAALKLLLVQSAIRYDDIQYATNLLTDLLVIDRYIPAAQVCVQLAQSIDDIDAKKKLLGSALWAVESDQLNHVLNILNNNDMNSIPAKNTTSYSILQDVYSDIATSGTIANDPTDKLDDEFATVKLMLNNDNTADTDTNSTASMRYHAYMSLRDSNIDAIDILSYTDQQLKQYVQHAATNSNTSNPHVFNAKQSIARTELSSLQTQLKQYTPKLDTNQLQSDTSYQHTILKQLLSNNRSDLFDYVVNQYNIDSTTAASEQLRYYFFTDEYTAIIDTLNTYITTMLVSPSDTYTFVRNELYIHTDGTDLNRLKHIFVWFDSCYASMNNINNQLKKFTPISIYKQHAQLIDRLMVVNIQCNYKLLLCNSTSSNQWNNILTDTNAVVLARLAPRISELLTDELVPTTIIRTTTPTSSIRNSPMKPIVSRQN